VGIECRPALGHGRAAYARADQCIVIAGLIGGARDISAAVSKRRRVKRPVGDYRLALGRTRARDPTKQAKNCNNRVCFWRTLHLRCYLPLAFRTSAKCKSTE